MAEDMNASSPASKSAPRPWTQTLFDVLPIEPVWIGLAIGVGHVAIGALFLALYFALFSPSGVGAFWPAYQEELYSTAVFALIIGYATAALAYARRAHERSLQDLRPVLNCDDVAYSSLRREIVRFDARVLRMIGISASIGAIIATYFTTGVADRLDQGPLLWILWQNAACFWLLARTITHDLRVSRSFSRAAERYAEIELFDLTPYVPLAGRGLQSALLIVLALSLFSLIMGGDDISPLVPAIQTGTVLLAALALVLPSLGLRRRIHAAKQEELAELTAEIRALRTRLRSTAASESPEHESRLATLLALKAHVDSAREWPFDLGTLGRFLLYSAIGVGSWLGGAAVERILDAFLG